MRPEELGPGVCVRDLAGAEPAEVVVSATWFGEQAMVRDNARTLKFKPEATGFEEEWRDRRARPQGESIMNSKVFIVGKDNRLTSLERSDYASEDLFQTLLADHPSILDMAAGENGRLLLVQREAPVPEAEDGGGRWSLDHLFLDQDGVPVLVEVKRASDTRARREVVAQMLDYAANGVAYWPIEQIVEAVRTSGSDDEDGEARLSAFLNGADAEAFWRTVESNLRSGRIRMVFVADRIPGPLRRIVEFLNEQMRPAEVLAIEVEHYATAEGLRLLTPRLVGDTERAKGAKAVQPMKPPLSDDDWLSDLAAHKGETAGAMARKILDWFRSRNFNVGMTASQDAMYASLSRPDGKPTWPFFVRRSTGKVETSLQYLKENPAFADETARLDLLDRLKSLPQVAITTSKSTGWPAVPLERLADGDVWDGFLKIAEDIAAANAKGAAASGRN